MPPRNVCNSKRSTTAQRPVTVHAENVTMVYTVNMETDVIETINFFTRAAVEPNARGEHHFVYLQELPDVIDPLFTTPPDIRPGSAPRQQIGILWLARLLTSQ